MATPFSQTAQALQADQGRFSLLSLGAAVVILLLWCWWLFYAPVYLYASSSELHVTSAEQPTWKLPEGGQRPRAYQQYEVRAQFKATDTAQIKAGQPAKLFLSSSDTLPRRPLPAIVDQVQADDGLVFLKLELPQDTSAETLAGATIERAEIAIAKTSPVNFLLHASFGIKAVD
jgi:multidrug resistance efflux pump